MDRPSGDRNDPASRIVDTRYLFNFVDPDGSRYVRQVYWESLYAFLPHGREVLVAARVVPHGDDLLAMYVALKYGDRPVHGEMLPQLPPGERTADLVRVVDGIMPSQQPALPAEVREQAALSLQMAVTQAMADHRAALPGLFLADGTMSADDMVGGTRPKPGTLFSMISLDE